MLSEKIKVLYPILHYPPVIGGLEQWSRQIAERQGEEMEVFIVTGRVRGERNIEEKKNVVLVRTSLFRLTDLSHSSFLYIAATTPYILFRSFLLARSERVDIFHCHGFISALTGYMLSLLRKTPFIVTEQSIGWSRGIFSWLRGVVYRKAFACIGASNATLEEFKKVGAERVYVIPNGVDVEKFRRCENCAMWQKNTRDFTVLGVGRLEKVKGYQYLIEAFEKIKKEIPESRLVLAGDGSERESLKKEVEKLGLKDSVQFLGEIAHDALPHLYHKADIFVMPSLSEGFGTVALEAMAAGLPVVATRVGGLLDIVENEDTGIFVEPGKAEDIFRAVTRLYGDKNLRLLLAGHAQKKVLQFDWDQSAKKVFEIYKECVTREIHVSR